MMLQVGEQIRRLRAEKGLTQDALAEMLCISGQSVSKWENGLSLPDIQYLPPLAKIFGVSIDALFGQTAAIEDGPAQKGRTHDEAADALALGPCVPQPEIDAIFAGEAQKKPGGRRVLVVDDAAFMRQMLAQLATDAGYIMVGEAANGFEAVEAAQALGPDIILMDIMMPGMDGLDATKRILESRPACVVLACSALAHGPTVWQAKAAGVSGFVAKPFLPEVLVAHLEGLFQ